MTVLLGSINSVEIVDVVKAAGRDQAVCRFGLIDSVEIVDVVKAAGRDQAVCRSERGLGLSGRGQQPGGRWRAVPGSHAENAKAAPRGVVEGVPTAYPVRCFA
ncbi:hypothetical protein [Actinoplanes subglobosus]|uniref:Uncharacterized protein n=1 Tax=Actinoplanes subglobosus TaxID=1547892 RepID=A0ABV8IUJ4_9ACTN